MGTTVRRATPADSEAIRNVGLRTWPATYEDFAGPAYVEHGLATWWSEEATRRSIAETTVLVAEDDGQVLGMASLDDVDGTPVIWKLYVLPEHQGRGVGSLLLASALRALPADSSRVVLEYTEGNDSAARFYQAKGFTELRREPGREGWPDAIWMELVLEATR